VVLQQVEDFSSVYTSFSVEDEVLGSVKSSV
jgi:hypothetical protein